MKTFHCYISLLLLIICSQAIAEVPFETSEASKIMVLHEGRQKPLDTFSRLILKDIYGREGFEQMDSNEWLLETLFTPLKSYQRSIFKINNPSAITTLGLTEGKKYFNFIEIYKAFLDNQDIVKSILSVSDEDLDPNNKYIKDLYLRFTSYMGLSRSFSFFFKDFKITEDQRYSYYDLKKVKNPIVPKAIQEFFETVEEDSVFKGINLFHDKNEDHWSTPWEKMHSDSAYKGELEQWQALYDSYVSQNKKQFDSAAIKLHSPEAKLKTILEVIQNKMHFTTWAIALYVISFLSFCIFMIAKKEFLMEITTLSLYTGAFIHICMIVFRSIILSRPPVTNLYESILFVSVTTVVVSIIYYLVTKKLLGVFLASVLGIILLFLSKGYERGGDNMGMIVAVLDTNFWLATHVLTISIGYGCALVTSAMAHYYLLRYKEHSDDENKKLHNAIHLSLLFSLFFTILGTILGGIWADQSWGRFWGWDPKENGALLICLWLLWIAHAKISRHFTSLSYAFFTGFTSVIVILAWFGVNLLNVGLHSYGFSNDTAYTIALFSLFELLFLGLLFFRSKGQQKSFI